MPTQRILVMAVIGKPYHSIAIVPDDTAVGLVRKPHRAVFVPGHAVDLAQVDAIAADDALKAYLIRLSRQAYQQAKVENDGNETG